MGTEEVLMTDRPYGVFYYIWISIAIVNFWVTLTVVVCRSEWLLQTQARMIMLRFQCR